MNSRNLMFFLFNLFMFTLFFLSSEVGAYDLNDKLTIEGSLSGVYQYGSFDDKNANDTGRGSSILDLGVCFHPTEKDEFFILMSYAAGNGLNEVSPFVLSPYADDLEDDLKNINGRNRDYLLEAWYKHRFNLSNDTSIGFTGGIIDATRYIDDNNFANCENTQFMNDVFVNNPVANIPSYDIGGVAEVEYKNLSAKLLMMNSKNEESKNYNYYAIQLGYKLETPIGEGNYRIYGFITNNRFNDWKNTRLKSLEGIGFSADQKISEIVGLFLRTGWQDDDAKVDYNSVYSLGANINGKLWGRECDEIGIGYAYLNGPDKSDIDNTNVLETYVKFKLTKFSDITLDLQYIRDKITHENDNEGFIYGIRLVANF
jgi:hypothetical protein